MRVLSIPVLGRFGFALLLASATLLHAQAPAQESQPAKQESKPAPIKIGNDDSVPAAPVDPKTYKIGAEDVINVNVWREPSLSGNLIVRPDGKITLPLAGELEAAGLTPEQLGVRVVAALGNFLTKPEVTISVVSVQSKRYYLSGKVGRSGPTPLVTPTTVLQALSSAGLGQWAAKNKIIIMRGTERIKFNYDEVIKGKKLEQNIYLQDGDHIYVP